MGLHSSLLDILACPLTKDKLIYDQKKDELISLKSGLAFPIVDGIPILLVENARKMKEKELDFFRKGSKVSKEL